MSQQLVIDGFAFTREGRVLEGTLPVSRLDRLHDLLTEVSGEVVYRLQGVLGESSESLRGQWLLRLEVKGLLPLECQRCLKAIPHELAVENLLQPVPEGSELSQDELEDDSRDFLPLPMAGTLDVAELVEDEILLSLPVAPRHQSCGLPGADEAGERISPFAALSGLKGRPN